MRRAETPQNVVKRLQGVVSPQVSSEHSGKIMENIAFLNRNCKFLSFVEKEKLIAQVKAQDPEVETLIYAVRDNNISKDEMKSSFYAYLYPKQGTKKPGESSTYAQRTKPTTVQKPFQFESRPAKKVPVAAVKLEHSLGDMLQAHKEAKLRPATTKHSETEYNTYYTGSGGRPGTRGISSNDAQGKIQRLSQRLQGGYFESAQARGRTGKTQQGYPGMGKISVAASMQYGGLPGTSSNNYSARGQASSAHREREPTSYGDGSSFGQYGSPAGHHHHHTEYEGTSQDFLLSLGIKRDNLSPGAGSISHRGDTPSAKGTQRSREQIYNAQINLAGKGGSVGNNKVDNKKRNITETFGQMGDLASRLHGTSLDAGGSSLKQSIWQQGAETEGYENSDVKRKRPPPEGKVNLDLKQSGKDLKLSGVSDKTKEVLTSLLGDLGDGELLQNVMRKLEDNQVQFDVESHRAEPIKEEEEQIYSPQKREPEARKSHWDMRNSAIVMGQAKSHKPYESAKKRTGSQIEDRIEGRRGVSLGGEGEYPIGLRSEKYVSVNVVKRILTNNLIYAEDLVDEIFRHLGDNIVNKNYFAQVIGNYLNCLPEQSGVQTQDIVNKMFEICDRNSDGLISPNDLGSGSMLFTQYRPLQSRERKLYRLFDPQNRGFIIETDIVSVLTKANTIANSSGGSIYSGPDEIADFARNFMRELDKEKKGIITYWDIFLWKDTEEFADLEEKLQQYTLQLEIVSSTKKSIMLSNSPPPNRDLKRSQVQNGTGASHLYSTYSPNINTQQDSIGLGTTYPADQARTLATAQSTVIQGGTDLRASTAAAQAANNQNLASPQLYTQHSPNHQLQNLSAFESISKEIRVEDMLQSVNSGGFGKMYGTDLSISPQSKAFTPIKDPIGTYTGHDALKSAGITPTNLEFKSDLGASKGGMDLLSGDLYKGERFDTLTSKEGTAAKPESYIYLTDTKTRENASPKIYETSYVYSSDTKAYMQSPAVTDYKGYLDLPYKSVEMDKMTSLTGQVDDMLQSATRAKDSTYQLESKPYTSSLGPQESKESQAAKYTKYSAGSLESKFYNYGIGPNYLGQKGSATDYANFTLGGQTLPGYGLEHNDSILDKKKEEERSYMQSLSSRDNQDISQKPELKESQYSADVRSHGYGHVSPSLLQGYDLKESVVAYNAESDAKDYSDKASSNMYGKSSAANSPTKSGFYKPGNEYEAYSSTLKESGHHGGYQFGQGYSSPGVGQYKSEGGSEYKGDYYGYSDNKRDSLSGYGSVQAGVEIAEEPWREKSHHGNEERYY